MSALRHTTHQLPITLAGVLATLAIAGPASGQVDTGLMGPLSLEVSVGFEAGGPANGLKEAYSAAGFDSEKPGTCFFGLCGGPVEYPVSERNLDRPEYSVEVRLRIHQHWSVAGAGGLGAAGNVQGHAAVPDRYSSVTYASEWFGVVVSGGTNRFRLGVGPDLERSHYTIGPDVGQMHGPQSSDQSSMGFIVEQTLRIARVRSFSLRTVARYRDGGTTHVVDPYGNHLSARDRTVFIGLAVGLGS